MASSWLMSTLTKLTHHFIYKNDETSLANYCASITMYPWLIGGTVSIGGNSTAPTDLKSYCGGFVNMIVHGQLDAEWCLRHAGVPDVYELLHR